MITVASLHRIFQALFISCFFIFITGCASSVQSNVSRFHNLVKNQQGQYGSYFFFIADDKKNSLEHKNYVDIVKSKLNVAGFHEETILNKADFVVFLNYSVTAGAGSSYTSISPVMAGNSAFAKGFNSAGQTAITTNSESYVRTVSLRIARFAADKPPEPLFESTLVSEGSSGQMSIVMPSLLEALFTNFPGKNRENFRVSTTLTE
jgi:Domain of unknown function (DUF4136)